MYITLISCGISMSRKNRYTADTADLLDLSAILIDSSNIFYFTH